MWSQHCSSLGVSRELFHLIICQFLTTIRDSLVHLLPKKVRMNDWVQIQGYLPLTVVKRQPTQVSVASLSTPHAEKAAALFHQSWFRW
jgi:hypothetical protein